MIILEALTKGEQALRRAFEGAPAYHQPKIDTQVLLAKALNRPTAFLFTHIDYALTELEEERFLHYLRRREQHEPVAYITGTQWFYGREFTVNEHTLIPRPDSEIMIERALPYIGLNTLVVDIGTGSGAIGLTVSAETGVPVICTDISKDAVLTARKNATNIGVDPLAHLLTGNLIEPLFTDHESYADYPSAVLLANLPYLSEQQYRELEQGVALYEPKGALVSGADGLDHYRALFEQIHAYRMQLPRVIRLFCEIDRSQRQSIIALAKSYRVTTFEIAKDLERRDRLAIFLLP